MKCSVVLFLVIAFVSIEASAQTYGLDNTDPAVFSKFRIPKTDLSSLWFNTNLDGSTRKYSNLYETGPNYNSMGTYLSSSLSPRYYMLKESDDRYLSLTCNTTGNYSYSDSRAEGPGVPSNNFQKNVSDGLNLTLAGTFRNYAPSGNLFYSVSSIADVDLSDQHSVYPSSDTTQAAYYTGTKAQVYTLSFGFGWGKMRNVTPVVSAIRFQERMKQLNLINSNLTEKTIEDLAQEFYRHGYYSVVHVRPDKFFWQDVEKTLSTDGITISGLNQYADSYLREVPNELRFMRNEGIVGGINLQVSYTNNYYSAYFRSPNGFITEELFALGNAYVNFSHQLNLNSQLNFSLSASGGPNLRKNPDLRQQYEISGVVGYNYELTDRIVAYVSNTFDVAFQNEDIQGRNLSNTMNFGMNYFIEDNVSLGASYSWNYFDQRGLNNTPLHTRQIDNYVSVGFTYYIDRGLLYN